MKPTFSSVSAAPAFPFRAKDPVSAASHFIGFWAAILLAPTLLIHAASQGAGLQVLVSLSIYTTSIILLYGASTAYHSFDISPRANKRLKKLDHAMIFLLIAGSYTPVCVIALPGTVGRALLALVWTLAALGIGLKLCWVTCPKWFSSVIYIGMGWLCIPTLPRLVHTLPPSCFGWLLAGGLAYTAGGVLYALKLSLFNQKHRRWGSHEIFHLFVLAGSACQFAAVALLPIG